jgi:hypothetical protein
MIDVGWPMLLSLGQPSVLPKDGVILLFFFFKLSWSSVAGLSTRGCEVLGVLEVFSIRTLIDILGASSTNFELFAVGLNAVFSCGST